MPDNMYGYAEDRDVDHTARSAAREAERQATAIEQRLEQLEKHLGIHWDTEEQAYYKRERVTVPEEIGG